MPQRQPATWGKQGWGSNSPPFSNPVNSLRGIAIQTGKLLHPEVWKTERCEKRVPPVSDSRIAFTVLPLV
jgi:hypothetical protein